MYRYFNPNPKGKSVGDCVIRAISKATNKTWDDTYLAIADLGFIEKDMPSANEIWGIYLSLSGFRRYMIPDTCPNCYTVRDFCADNRWGTFILATGSHVVTVVNGDYYDAWDSGNEVPVYYWKESR